MINYRSITALNKQIRTWVKDLPRDLDLIVGIPRSGLLVANILALQLDLPLADFDGFLKEVFIKSGRRNKNFNKSQKLNVLIVDDSVNSGGQIKEARQKIQVANLPHKIYYAAVYVNSGSEQYVDYFCERLNVPRVFEWNLTRHSILMTSCFDIDGVLCFDPSKDEDDDGRKYEEFIKNAKPLLIPSVPVGWLVTCRLEKYRELTESWLKKYGIEYRELIMMKYQNKEDRVKANSHSAYKASVYKDTGADLFIESSLSQSIDIAFLSQKNVLCMDTRELVAPILSDSQEISIDHMLKNLVRKDSRLLKEAGIITSELDWTRNLQLAIREILEIIPTGSSFILIDEHQWGVCEVFAGRNVFPFLEKDGHYNGVPSDDALAINEINRMHKIGADFLVLAWQSFWWLDYFTKWHNYLRDSYSCIIENERLVIFDLNKQVLK